MYSLFLYELGHISETTEIDLTEFLITQQFIKSNDKKSFLPSESFMQLITFLGCSPVLTDELVIEINLHFYSNSTALGGDSINSIQCPQCKSKIKKPADIIINQDKKLFCNDCKNHLDIKSINWRKSAATSTKFIQIHNIFPKEAIPSDQLLNALNTFTNSKWSYFYSKSFH